MNCDECKNWLHPYVDNELDTPLALQVSAHVKTCEVCNAQLLNLQKMRELIQKNAPYHAAPELLKNKISNKISLKSTSTSTSKWQWLAPAASSIALAASVLFYISVPSQQDLLINDVVSSHVRSLMENHLTDVTSTDKHTVKPWFTGKLDFSPPVVDFTAEGFPLIGGRLEYLHHKNTAALVYKSNKHVINLFIAPTEKNNSSPQAFNQHGFNIISWKKDHLAFEAVSDLNAEELNAFSKIVIAGNSER